jgi:hypothetical protein
VIGTADLRTRIDQEFFDYTTLLSCLEDYCKPRDRISALLASGDIVRVKKGLYVFGERYRRGPYTKETLANLIYGPSYISGDYALAYYGMIPERVSTMTSVTTGKRRTFNTPLGTFTYSPLRASRYHCGMDRVELDSGAAFLIATREKALLDKAWLDRRFHAESLADCQVYLTEDLRINEGDLFALAPKTLGELATHYTSAKISRIVRAIERLREQKRE